MHLDRPYIGFGRVREDHYAAVGTDGFGLDRVHDRNGRAFSGFLVDLNKRSRFGRIVISVRGHVKRVAVFVAKPVDLFETAVLGRVVVGIVLFLAIVFCTVRFVNINYRVYIVYDKAAGDSKNDYKGSEYPKGVSLGLVA